MTSVFLSCYNLPVIKQVAEVLGLVMNLLYKFFSMFGIFNIGLCIILFTIIIKMILLPMTIKQQRFTKLSAIMNPEIQAVQKKYKEKRDQDSMMKMNQEMSAIYEKYGTSPTGGCLTLLIQMPILLALYGVISQVPIFIPEIGDYFNSTSEVVSESVQYFDDIDKLDELKYDTDENDYLDQIASYYKTEDGKINKEDTSDEIYGSFTKIASSPADVFNIIFGSYDEADEIIDKLSSLTASDWEKLLADNKDDSDLINEYKDKNEAQWKEIKELLGENRSKVEDIDDEVSSAYDLIGVNLSKSPSATGGLWALIIPILAAASQLISVKVSNKMNSNNQASGMDNPMGSSMKMMTYTMPVMSAIFCYTLPAGLGLYWIMSAVVQTVQTIAINKYFVKVDVNDIIKANIEKVNKKRAKQGLPPKKITNAATANVKNIKVAETKPVTKPETTSNNSASGKGGISAKANLVNKYNNSKK